MRGVFWNFNTISGRMDLRENTWKDIEIRVKMMPKYCVCVYNILSKISCYTYPAEYQPYHSCFTANN